MISEKTFASGFALLCKQHGRNPSTQEPLMKIWKRLLDQHLTDEDFQDAIAKSIFEDRYWPSPKQLVSHVRRVVTADQLAEVAWDRVQEVLSNPSKPLHLDEPGFSALRAVGGRHHLSHLLMDRLPFLRKDFIAAYKTAAPDREIFCGLDVTPKAALETELAEMELERARGSLEGLIE